MFLHKFIPKITNKLKQNNVYKRVYPGNELFYCHRPNRKLKRKGKLRCIKIYAEA